MTDTFRSRGGRQFSVQGDASLLTLDRMQIFQERADSDPRIASLSLVAGPARGAWLRGAGPSGVLVAIATDIENLVGPPAATDPTSWMVWCRDASVRGLWHDWWVTSDTDVVNATVIFPPTEVDVIEAADLSGAHAPLFHEIPRVKQLTLTVDVSWLGPHETGAQVLTTSALSALVHQDAIAAIRLVGVSELPEYAHHLVDEPKVEVLSSMDETPVSDLIWYPNQVDGRGSMASARRLGRRVVVTYLDLIAYDIRRYHATTQAWQVYRALQRRIALSVDGVATISTDVATRMMEEVPRLDPARVQPILLGLDHVTAQQVPVSPPEHVLELAATLGSKRFVLVMGNDFGHKNRDFAIRVWQQVLQAGQQCDLVLAGLHVRGSSSKDAEDALTALHVDLRGRVHTVGHVDSASCAWLLSHAAVVLYPTSAEGFGLVPYEAAALGTPSTFTDFGPLREVSGAKGLPKGWSLDAYAADVVSMLTDPNAAEARIGTLMQAISRHSWDTFATELVDFFKRIAAMPVSPAGLIGGDSAADAAALASILSSRSYRLATRMQGVAGRLRRR